MKDLCTENCKTVMKQIKDTNEWKEKTWYVYRVQYYSAIKKNEIMPFAATWMKLEIINPSEVSQKD